MNKSVKRIVSLMLCGAMAFPLFSFVGCGGEEESSTNGEKVYVADPETRPVVFSTDALDKNFNPFFATSATDSEITAQTQLGMLTTTTNEDGKDVIVAGEEYPTVVLDYNVSDVKKDENNKEYTDYEFIIKKGIKFSDGVDLTIKDVLFNLYVYLDPQYMGSATLYSTKIRGLNAYRSQSANVTDDDDLGELQDSFNIEATGRLRALTDYLNPPAGEDKPALTPQITSDIELLKRLFKEEVESDWTTNSGQLESYKDYRFTEDWEVYYYVEGIISDRWQRVKKTVDGKEVITYEKMKDSNGKFYTTLDVVDENGDPFADDMGNSETHKEDMMAALTDSEWIANAQAAGKTTDADIAEYIKKYFAIETVYNAYAPEDDSESAHESLANIVTYWATGDKLREQFVADAMSAANDNLQDGELLFKSISGITTGKTSTDFDGNALSSEHDVLKIRINGVDPKAIYNFAFSVAPMHYYSGEYNGVDYRETAKNGENFGVAFREKDFFDNVLQAPEKSGLPVGAGVYKASNLNGGKVNKDNFCENNWVYFERNPYFETVDGEGSTAITNAKIKYLRYKVVGSDKIITSLAAKEIDIGEPNATPKNVEKIGQYSFLGQKSYVANGYGYVGINPKYIPDIEVRQAIMKAMNTSLTVTSYYQNLASVIYRPMSLTSWAHPKQANGLAIGEHSKVAYYLTDPDPKATKSEDDIRKLVAHAGYTEGDDGIYANAQGDKLEYTFTIAGNTEDHPAYTMFEDAAEVLNRCGFKITIKTDPSALKKLATGGLQVWAAAWSSTIDPDMYQVYHKDSTATSVKNWGYDVIFADTTGQFNFEQETINSLSEKIEAARATTSETQRKAIYAECLDLVMELCIELPTYQRRDLIAYNKDLIDTNTFYQGEPTANTGVKLWELNYKYTIKN